MRKRLGIASFNRGSLGGQSLLTRPTAPSVSIVAIRPPIKRGIKSTDVNALPYAAASPIVVFIAYGNVCLAKAVTSVSSLLHNGGLVFAVVQLGG